MAAVQLADNLWQSDEEREFFVLVPPEGMLVKHNLGLVGSFTGGPLEVGQDTPDQLLFIPNKTPAATSLTPFHSGLISWYTMDYNLELQRHNRYRDYPSRFHALYLLNSREDAQRYRETHPSHVAGRVLKRCVTIGTYRYSSHDSAWIEFLRSGGGISDEVINETADLYWSGRSVEGNTFQVMGQMVELTSSREVLLYGRVDFPNKDLNADD